MEKIGISKYKEIIRKNEKRKMKNIQSGRKGKSRREGKQTMAKEKQEVNGCVKNMGRDDVFNTVMRTLHEF